MHDADCRLAAWLFRNADQLHRIQYDFNTGVANGAAVLAVFHDKKLHEQLRMDLPLNVPASDDIDALLDEMEKQQDPSKINEYTERFLMLQTLVLITTVYNIPSILQLLDFYMIQDILLRLQDSYKGIVREREYQYTNYYMGHFDLPFRSALRDPVLHAGLRVILDPERWPPEKFTDGDQKLSLKRTLEQALSQLQGSKTLTEDAIKSAVDSIFGVASTLHGANFMSYIQKDAAGPLSLVKNILTRLRIAVECLSKEQALIKTLYTLPPCVMAVLNEAQAGTTIPALEGINEGALQASDAQTFRATACVILDRREDILAGVLQARTKRGDYDPEMGDYNSGI